MAQYGHWMNESDIGSGEKPPSQEELEKDQSSIGAIQNNGDGNGSSAGRVLQSGTHLARILTSKQPDGQYEAQVYVRLTREPQEAETYIPAGSFPTEGEAWQAAEERAKRALREQEF